MFLVGGQEFLKLHCITIERLDTAALENFVLSLKYC